MDSGRLCIADVKLWRSLEGIVQRFENGQKGISSFFTATKATCTDFDG